MNTIELEREHSRYENALDRVEGLAQDGIEQLGAAEKNAMLVEIRDEAAEALE